MMEKLLEKARKRAAAALKKALVERKRLLERDSYRKGRFLQEYYLEEFWKSFYSLAQEKYGVEHGECDSTAPLVEAFGRAVPMFKCDTRVTIWKEFKLANHKYGMLEEDGLIYIAPYGASPLPVTMLPDDLVATILAFDSCTSDAEIDKILEEMEFELSVEEKCTQVLNATAMGLIGNQLGGKDVQLDVRCQKNGRLLCRIRSLASWRPDTIFRTDSFETFLEDFKVAYKRFAENNPEM